MNLPLQFSIRWMFALVAYAAIASAAWRDPLRIWSIIHFCTWIGILFVAAVVAARRSSIGVTFARAFFACSILYVAACVVEVRPEQPLSRGLRDPTVLTPKLPHRYINELLYLKRPEATKAYGQVWKENGERWSLINCSLLLGCIGGCVAVTLTGGRDNKDNIT